MIAHGEKKKEKKEKKNSRCLSFWQIDGRVCSSDALSTLFFSLLTSSVVEPRVCGDGLDHRGELEEAFGHRGG